MAVYDESAKALGKALEGNILTALSLYGNKPPMRAPRQWARSLPEEHQEGSMCEALHTARVINVNGKKGQLMELTRWLCSPVWSSPGALGICECALTL